MIEQIEPKLYNKDGSLTTFAFRCGHIQSKHIHNVRVELRYYGRYHVKVYDRNLKPVMQHWDSFTYLTTARAKFKDYVRRYESIV